MADRGNDKCDCSCSKCWAALQGVINAVHCSENKCHVKIRR